MSFQDIQGGPHPPSRRNQSPAQAVAAGIFQINTSVATFRRLVDAVGTVKDTPEHRQKLYRHVTPTYLVFFFFLCFHSGLFGRHNTRQRILQQVKDTSAKLKSLSESDRGANSNVGFSFLVIFLCNFCFFFPFLLFDASNVGLWILITRNWSYPGYASWFRYSLFALYSMLFHFTVLEKTTKIFIWILSHCEYFHVLM